MQQEWNDSIPTTDQQRQDHCRIPKGTPCSLFAPVWSRFRKTPVFYCEITVVKMVKMLNLLEMCDFGLSVSPNNSGLCSQLINQRLGHHVSSICSCCFQCYTPEASLQLKKDWDIQATASCKDRATRHQPWVSHVWVQLCLNISWKHLYLTAVKKMKQKKTHKHVSS